MRPHASEALFFAILYSCGTPTTLATGVDVNQIEDFNSSAADVWVEADADSSGTNGRDTCSFAAMPCVAQTRSAMGICESTPLAEGASCLGAWKGTCQKGRCSHSPLSLWNRTIDDLGVNIDPDDDLSAQRFIYSVITSASGGACTIAQQSKKGKRYFLVAFDVNGLPKWIIQRPSWIGALFTIGDEHIGFASKSNLHSAIEMYANGSPSWSTNLDIRQGANVMLARTTPQNQIVFWAYPKPACGDSAEMARLGAKGEILDFDAGSMRRLYDAKWTGSDFITVGTGGTQGLCLGSRIARWAIQGIETSSTLNLVMPPQNGLVAAACIGDKTVWLASAVWLQAFEWDGALRWQHQTDGAWQGPQFAESDHLNTAGCVVRLDGAIVNFGNVSSQSGTQNGYVRVFEAKGAKGWSRDLGHIGAIGDDDGNTLIAETPNGGYYVGGSTLRRLDAFGHALPEQSGPCSSYTPDACDDGDPCTLDDCVAPQGCVNTPRAEGEWCGPSLVCASGKCSASK